MAAAPPEIWSYVLYAIDAAAPPLWHQRLRLGLVADSLAQKEVIATPDGDIYVETLLTPCADISAARFTAEFWPPPLGIPRGRAYRFRRRPTDAQILAMKPAAEAAAREAWLEEHPGQLVPDPVLHEIQAPVVLPLAAAAPPPPLGLGLADVGFVTNPDPTAGSTWTLAEDLGEGFGIGQVVEMPALFVGNREVAFGPPPPGAPQRGLVFYKAVDARAAGRASPDDARLLAVMFDAQGARNGPFADAVSLMYDPMLPGGNGLDGPPTVFALAKEAVGRGGSFEMSHIMWKRDANIPSGDRAIYEDEVLSMALQHFAMVDQVNLPALKGCELLARRLQLIREAYRISPSAPDFSASDHFMGWGPRRGGAGATSGLTAHVSEKLRAEASIAKGARKAREERALKVPKGRGKGKKGDPAAAAKGDGAE